MTIERVCDFDTCSNPPKARGLCRTHYGQWQRGEEPYAIKVYPEVCSFPDCGREHYAIGYCSTHYQMQRKGVALRPIKPVRDVTARNERGEKECIRCSRWLPESGFPPASHTRDGRAVHCLVCKQVRRFGITRTDYESLLNEQGGVCAICKGVSVDGKALHIDHDHACCPGLGRSCGRCVRGLLCDNCNKGLGCFQDDPLRLAQAVIYLKVRSAA